MAAFCEDAVKVAVFSTKPYDQHFINAANDAAGSPYEIVYFDAHLNDATATLAKRGSRCLSVRQ